MATQKRKNVKKATRPAKRSTASIQQISPCLWFDGNAEEAARFYVSVFPKAKITGITHYPDVGQETHGRAPGSVMTVDFTLNGLPFMGLNGGPLFKFNEAISLVVNCDSQAEIDHYWEKLGAGGDPQAQQCGWLKDKYGLSWQIVPTALQEMYKAGVSAKSERAMKAMLQMKKLDIAALQKAYDGAA